MKELHKLQKRDDFEFQEGDVACYLIRNDGGHIFSLSGDTIDDLFNQGESNE